MKEKAITLKSQKTLSGAGAIFLLLSFLPILSDYKDFFLFGSIIFLIGGFIPFLFHPKLVYRDRNDLLKNKNVSKESVFAGKNILKTQFSIRQSPVTKILFIIIISGFLINQFLLIKYNRANSSGKNQLPIVNNVKPASLSVADQSIIAQLQQQGKEIPVLGSAHIHADFKVFINGNALDFAKPEYFMKSSFIHVDNQVNKGDASGVLHMHAKKVPLWVFFKSLGMNLTRDSLTLADGQVLKKENGNTLKFYLNGQKVDELGDYSFQPLDKLLISYGSADDPDIQKQINSIASFAKNH